MNTLLLIGGFIGFVAIVIVILVVSGVFSSNDKQTTSSSSGGSPQPPTTSSPTPNNMCSKIIPKATANKLYKSKVPGKSQWWEYYESDKSKGCTTKCSDVGDLDNTKLAFCFTEPAGSIAGTWAYCDKSCKKEGDGLTYLNE